ncbi:hypothetical protein DLJ74_19425 [Gracilibacillus dipsosauri]|uniref:Uncharacterized protein n=1 Tax=Gracilibacillus dipsosauri TaxID=178340 RepID=A0A317KTW5_9BACI|nr:hypothetical protein DLJ74_19425 [Gracilibacillus dipsosauri]
MALSTMISFTIFSVWLGSGFYTFVLIFQMKEKGHIGGSETLIAITFIVLSCLIGFYQYMY